MSKPRIPPSALLLGIAGLVPFVATAAASWLTEGFLQAQAWYALTAYGAVILSFLGGVHWGAAMRVNRTEAETQKTGQPVAVRLVVSVVPSLIGWAALLMPTRTGLIAMALGFAAMLLTDIVATRSGQMSDWYPRLRWPLTIVVIGCLVIGATA